MKSTTKSCQRPKNILANGFCTTCNKAKKVENPQKQKTPNNKIEVNVNEIKTIYNKLKMGDVVDQNVVNSVIIGGILGFISQNDANLQLKARVSELESDLKTSKLRIDSLENWMTRNEEDKKIIEKDKKKCYNLIAVLSEQKEAPIIQHEASPKSVQQTCSQCGEVFSKNSDFEIHMEENHNVDKNFKCDICGKLFVLEWRLKKHRHNHTEKPKKCKFFLNKEPCPFDLIGCKFVHDNHQESDIETVEDEITLKPNQCHLCMLQLSSKDHLWDHVEIGHVDYFQGMMEYTAENRS